MSRYDENFDELELIGDGCFSIVFKSKFKKDDRHYAIKKIPFVMEEEKNTLKEISLLSQLDKNYVVEFINSWIEPNYYINTVCNFLDQKCIVFNPKNEQLLHVQMELCSMTLKTFIMSANYTSKNSLTLEQYIVNCSLLYQILECLNYLHNLSPQIIHRDLKPSNILLLEIKGEIIVKLSDFGLSTSHKCRDESHTICIGSTRYRAPEVDFKLYDTQADIYSLGRIIEDLFNFDINNEVVYFDAQMESKCAFLLKIAIGCVSILIKDRPTCISILENKKFWFFSPDVTDKETEKLNTSNLIIPNISTNLDIIRPTKVSTPLQLLCQTSNGYELNTIETVKILDKIGDRNVAIISIIGNKRTGKSFLLNYFLGYLNYHSKYGKEWVNGVNETTLNGFDWRGGAQRHTVGIWMWSEPFMVKDRYGNDIALLLVDTQGSFDEETTFQDCSVIFSLSLLLSTTLILNIKNDLSEDKLQFVEFFTTFADYFSGESQSNGALFQKLVLLIRDWESEESYPLGYHDHINPLENNYTKERVYPNSHQCLEAQNTRKDILKYFNQVSSYLMPHPGRLVSKPTFKGQKDFMETEFVESIDNFVMTMLSSDNIEPKQIGGQLITGNILKQYLIKWAEVIRTHKIPEARKLMDATAEVNYILALKHALSLYQTSMNEFMGTKPTDYLLWTYHETTKAKSFDYFLHEPKARISDERKLRMCDELNTSIDQTLLVFRNNNSHRIEKKNFEGKLNEVHAEQQQIMMELEEIIKENWIKINDLQITIKNIYKELMKILAEQETKFKEEMDGKKLFLAEQNYVNKKMFDKLEEKINNKK